MNAQERHAAGAGVRAGGDRRCRPGRHRRRDAVGAVRHRTLVLDRHETVYPLPRAVHADDEVYRILARLGIGDEFAAHCRPGLGLRLIDPRCGC